MDQHCLTLFTYVLSLFFFMYLVAQLLQGRLPSHLVFRARQRSQLAQSEEDSLFEGDAVVVEVRGADPIRLVGEGDAVATDCIL